MPHWKLASFDLDGTLVRNRSTGEHLAAKIGHLAEMQWLEGLYASGHISNAEVAERDASYYAGYSPEDIAQSLADLPLIADIGKTVDYLAAQGIPAVISTLAWDCVAATVARRFGFLAWSGPALRQDETGRFTGAVRSHFLDEDKISFVKGICATRGIALEQVFHVGDSRSDIPLFGQVGFAIALNANALAKRHAHASLDSESLFESLALVPGLMK